MIRWQIKKIKILLLAIALILASLSVTTLTRKVWAAPTFPTFEDVQKMIADALAPVQEAIKNLSSRLTAAENTLSPIPAEIVSLQLSSATMSAAIADLQARVAALENPPQPPPTPQGLIIFAFNRPASFVTDSFIIPSGFNYRSMTFHVSTTDTLINWAPLVDIGQGFIEQVRLNCSGLHTCPEVTIPILQHLASGLLAPYKFGTGTSGGNVTAIASLNSEPNSQSILIASSQSLPFISGQLPTGGYRSIIFTVAQGNPQNLRSISLQGSLDGIEWIEEQHVNCDGGVPECPVVSLPLSPHRRYRVVVDGSGDNALIAALIRP